MTLRTVGVRLTAEIGDYQSKLKAAGQSTRDFKGEIDKASKKGSLDAVATQAAAVGLGLAGLAAAAIKSAADFDKSMSSVAAATHAPKAEMDQLRQAAIQAGKDTMYSATEAADGITELAKAGVSTANILGGGLKGALSLAAAGQLGVGEAAGIAASAMTQFKLSGDQIPHVADLLAAGAGKAQGSVHDLGYALDQSGLVAAQFGLSVEDTTGVLAEFAAAGMTGSDAGTSLKTMLLSLANPSDITSKRMAALGISFYDATGKFIGLDGVAEVLRQRLGSLTDQQRQSTLAQIFGNDAVRGASILYTDGAAGVQKWKGAVNDAGYAASTAQKQTDNLAGDIERLKGSLETLAIEGGSGPNAGIRKIAQLLNTLVTQFANLNPVVGEVVVILAGLSGALLLGLAAWVKYKKVVTEAQDQLIATGPAGEKAASAIGRVSSALGAVGTVIAFSEALSMVFDQIDKKTTDVNKLTDAVQNLFQTGKTAGELNSAFGDNWDKLNGIATMADGASHGWGKFIKSVDNSIPGIGAAANSLSNLGERLSFGTDSDQAVASMASLDTALTTNITSIHDYTKASDLWQQVLVKSGLNTEQLAALLPNTYKELGVLSAASEKGAAGMKGLANQANGVTGKIGDTSSALAAGADDQKAYRSETELAAAAARGEKDALVDLSKVVKGQSDPVFALLNAEDSLTTAQKNATKAIKDHGRNSSQASAATRQLAESAIDLQQKVGALGNSFDFKLSPAFRQTLKAAGLTNSQIKDVSKQFQEAKKDADKYTGNYAAKVTAPGAPQAKKQIDDAYTAAKGFDGPYVADLKVTGLSAVQASFRKLSAAQQALKSGNTISRLSGFAEGGWTGPGAKYQPAGIVHADEFVINKNSRQKIETKAPGLLNSMNATGNVPGYAGGGHVMPYPVTAAMTKIPTEAQALSKILGSAGGGSLGAWIRQGIMLAGVPASWGGPLRTLIMRESGGNPHAINLSDINAMHGDPSRGLMQTIGSTFEHYRSRSLPDDIYNPVANIVAGLRYIESRYGSIFNVQQANANLPPRGYANGGWITEPVNGVGASGRRYTFAENHPEYVDNRAWRAGPGGGSGGGGGSTIHITFSGPVGSRYELENWLTGAVDNLKKRGRI
jgi:TP901 family phage tail tape measure protein